MKWLSNLLSDGELPSTKRVIAIGSFIVAVVYCFVVKPDPVILGIWISNGTILLGIGAVTKS